MNRFKIRHQAKVSSSKEPTWAAAFKVLMVRRLASLVLLLVLVVDCHKNIDWCLYFRILGRDHLRPECNGIYRSRVMKHRDHTPAKLPPLPRELIPSFRRFKLHRTSIADLTRKTLGLNNCSAVVSRCRQSLLCHNGLMCYSFTGYCCLDMKRVTMVNDCSPLGSQTIQCSSAHSSSICRHDFHCRFTSKRKCCPSRCGYNLCI